MILLLLLQFTLTFDPSSVKTIEYLPQNARVVEAGTLLNEGHKASEGTVVFKQVLLTFEKMIILKPGESIASKASGPAPRMHPEAEQGSFFYRPKDCKPLGDVRQHWVCKDPHWGKQPPTIWWEPMKKQADPIPARREPLA